jgi:hypothetical protein
MATGVPPTKDEVEALRRTPVAELARIAQVGFQTAQRARAGQPVRRVTLRALLEAAAWVTSQDKAKADALCPPQSATPGERSCVQCCRECRFVRRGLCRTCHRKLKDAGIGLPPPGKRGRAARTHLAKVRAWFRALPRDQQAVIRVVAKELAA